MSSYLLSRSLGLTDPQAYARAETARLVRAIQPAPAVEFDGREDGSSRSEDAAQPSSSRAEVRAHRAGVNSLAIDRFEGRFAVSGGADASIHLWDLEGETATRNHLHRATGTAPKSKDSHKFAISHLSFYPFDAFAFLSSSYDHRLNIYETESLRVSASFNLDSIIYSHALSFIADHLLVACATQHPTIRLVDLRSGASAQALAGHAGAVLSVAWSPRDDNILASGGSDGTVRFWDIRRSAGCLGMLDLEDSHGVLGADGRGSHGRVHGQAHVGACNGVVWTDRGDYLVTTGHDERVRVWNMALGANTLSHFGPVIKNANLSTLLPLVVSSRLTAPEREIVFYPNEKEILMFDMLQGTLLKRLRVPGTLAQAQSSGRNIRSRATCLAWRDGHVEMYSGHSDGTIRAWVPHTASDQEADTGVHDLETDSEDGERKRKRQALNDIYRDLTRQKITFT